MSATPYKLYSTLEEIDENQIDEHYAEFFQVMNFLFDDEVKDIKFKEVWKNYSHALSELKAGDSAIIRMKELAENAMYQGVSRTERICVKKISEMPLTHQCVHLCLPQHQSDRKDWIFIITAE